MEQDVSTLSYDELAEDVRRMFNAMRCADLAALITSEQLRQSLIVDLCDLYEIPNGGNYTPKGLEMMLVGMRLKEDSIPGTDRRAEMRGILVARLAGAAFSLQSGDFVPAADDLAADPSPVRPSAPRDDQSGSTAATALDEPGGDMILDISDAIADADGSNLRFRGGPPDLVLFSGGPAENIDLPLDYMSLLTPPPSPHNERALLGKWLSGAPVTPWHFAFGIDRLSEAGREDLIEMEAELTAAPRATLERAGHRRVLRPAKEGAEGALRDFAGFDQSLEETQTSDLKILEAFKSAVGQTLVEVWPEMAKRLQDTGATLRVGADLMGLLRTAWAMETTWLAEFGGSLDGPKPNILGTPLPEGEMSPGLLFRRAAFLHLASADHPADALREAALDMRFAMVVRGVDADDLDYACETFNDIFFADCAADVSAFRIAKNEIAPAM